MWLFHGGCEMPVYRYRCQECGTEFEEQHRMNDVKPDCPECFSEDVERLIVDAPLYAQGALTHAGDGKRATKEQLQDKWREETPKLRKKLRDKLGDEAIKNMPSLNMNIKDD
jgi:putative FmdB family regulatory protein